VHPQPPTLQPGPPPPLGSPHPYGPSPYHGPPAGYYGPPAGFVEHQQRVAAAAEATKRNTTILVWALVGIPLIIGAIIAIVLAASAASSDIGERRAQSSLEQVEEVYQSVGYSPPSYTTIQNQANGICSNLRSGMSQPAAALAMAEGFADGLTTSQATPIAAAVSEHLC
jgi:hypothetical protein